MPSDPFHDLNEAELEKLLLDLGGYTAYRVRNFRWRSGNYEDLSNAMQPKNVVQEALTRVLEERRHFDGARGRLISSLAAENLDLFGCFLISTSSPWLASVRTSRRALKRPTMAPPIRHSPDGLA